MWRVRGADRWTAPRSVPCRSMDRDALKDLITAPQCHLDDADPEVRRLAVSASAGRISEPHLADAVKLLAETDPDPRVRAEAIEVLGQAGSSAQDVLLRLVAETRTTDDPVVVEAVATSLGETATNEAVPWLIDVATSHNDKLVREAAVAALGAIGDRRALPTLLRLAASGPPQIRRRSVVALAAFEGNEVEAAITAALEDRNPMVREVAEMVVGRPLPNQ